MMGAGPASSIRTLDRSIAESVARGYIASPGEDLSVSIVDESPDCRFAEEVATPVGFEPTTSDLEGRRSIQMS